jgi:hypothetical protein
VLFLNPNAKMLFSYCESTTLMVILREYSYEFSSSSPRHIVQHVAIVYQDRLVNEANRLIGLDCLESCEARLVSQLDNQSVPSRMDDTRKFEATGTDDSTCQGQEQRRRRRLTALSQPWPAAACCLLAVIVAAKLLQEPDAASDGGPRRRLGSLGEPAALMGYEQFRELAGASVANQTGLEHSRESLLFYASLIDIGRHNLAALANLETYFLEQNSWMSFDSPPASSLEHLQQPELLDGPVGSLGTFILAMRRPKVVKYNLTVDHTKCLGEARNQGSCGACYAFAGMALAEWHYCKLNGTVVDFSEQYILDCGHVTKLNGCKNGRLSLLATMIPYQGLLWESERKYLGRVESEASCALTKPSLPRIKVDLEYFERIEITRENLELALSKTPVLLEMKTPRKFLFYSGGIDPGDDCWQDSGHAMLMVGHGKEDDQEYWLIRNSFSTKWGENGHWRLSKNVKDIGHCIKSAFVAKLKFEDTHKDVDPAVNKRLKEAYEEFHNQPYEGGRTLKLEPPPVRKLPLLLQV